MFVSPLAQAAGVSDPVIVSPTGTVANGAPSTVTINFSNAPADTYDVTIAASDYSAYLTSKVTYDGVTDLVTSAVGDTPLATGTYSIEVMSSDSAHTASGTFTVAAPLPPVLAFSGVSVSPALFYPLVQDGYRDTTTMRYTLNRSAHIVASVMTPGGTVIRTVDLGTRMGSSWVWNGRKNNGAFAATGYYNIRISATATLAPASTKSVVFKVRLATGYIIKSASRSRTGYNTSGASHTSSCYTDYYPYSQELQLDCWGGAYARADYGFTIPSSAYSITWGVTGYQACCSEGVISKTGARPSRTYYRVSVRVTSWRSYIVQSARVSYHYKVRI
jgi:methionine-rich copper-binding protein CopC